MKIKDLANKGYGCVYCLTFPDGKEYVGKTLDIGSRIDLYIRNIDKEGSGGRVMDAIRSFGIDNIEISVLCRVDGMSRSDKELCLNILEIRYIRERDCIYPKGYNTSVGGELLGIPVEDITTDREYIDSLKNKSKAILCYNLSGDLVSEYPSVACCGYAIGCGEDSVRKALGRKSKPLCNRFYLVEKRYGFAPEHIDVPYYEVKEKVRYKYKTETIVNRREVTRDFTKYSISVIAYDTNGDFVGEYPSKLAACRALYGKNKSFPLGIYYKGFILYEKESDDYPKKIESIDAFIGKSLGNTYVRPEDLKDLPKSDVAFSRSIHSKLRVNFPINQYSLSGAFLQRFDSIRDASLITGIPYSAIYACVLGRTKRGKGYIWRKSE